MTRVVLSALQLRRALDNAGGLWSVPALQKMNVIREGDIRIPELPKQVRIGRLTYFCGWDMVAFAEQQGRAAAADALQDAIQSRDWQHEDWSNTAKSVRRAM